MMTTTMTSTITGTTTTTTSPAAQLAAVYMFCLTVHYCVDYITSSTGPYTSIDCDITIEKKGKKGIQMN
jgi:hypothetical protein